MNPYEVLGFEYTHEEEDTNEKVQKQYEDAIKLNRAKYQEIQDKYNFTVEQLNGNEEIGVKKLESIYGKISIDDVITDIDSRYDELMSKREEVIEILKSTMDLRNAFEMIKTASGRLKYQCDKEKKEKEYDSSLIVETSYKPASEYTSCDEEKAFSSENIKSLGILEYRNWTRVVVEYIIQYKVVDKNGKEHIVFVNLPQNNNTNEELIEFLYRTILDSDYLEYAANENAGYLGEVRTDKNGKFIIEFDYEELTAVIEYRRKEKRDNRERED